MTNLLNIDANAKTVKGQKRGYMTAVMYLAPYTHSGRNVCPFAKQAKCWIDCLNTAGRGGIAKRGAIIATDAGTLPDNAIQRARLWRTDLYWNDRDAFMAKLVKEISAFIRKAKRAGLIPCVRLNGTSDIDWTRERVHSIAEMPEVGARWPRNIFEAFPAVQFYDYTKVYKRFRKTRPSNYHLSLSYSGANPTYANACRVAHSDHGAPLVIVMRDKAAKSLAMLAMVCDDTQRAENVVDGDVNDLRFLDPPAAMVYLYAKGSARRDTSGFVLDV